MLGDMTAETLRLIKEAQLAKDATTTGISTTTGVVEFNLERAAKLLLPTQTPLRNRIPRAGLGAGERGHGVAAHWRAIINILPATGFEGVSEGNRGALKQTQERDLLAAFKGIGIEDSVTYEADWAAEGFDDVKALAVKSTLAATMIGEEKMILWGNNSLALGTTPTPTVVDAGGSGSPFTATVQSVYCVALTPLALTGIGGLITPFATGTDNRTLPTVGGQSSRASAGPYTNTDTINLGNAKISSAGTVTPVAGHNITATVANGVKGACAYAWFLGANGASGATAFLVAVTSVPTVTLSAIGNAANQNANSTNVGTDFSTNGLAFDGLIQQALNASAWAAGTGIFNVVSALSPAPGGGYALSLNGSALTGGTGIVNEIDTALKWFFDAYRIWPDTIYVGSKQAQKITNLIVGSSAPLFQVQQGGRQGEVQGGFLVTTYMNKFALGGAKPVDIFLHPFMPDSWIYFHTQTIADKYPIGNVAECNRVKVRRDYYQKVWPEITRKYEYGVYVDEVLQCYTPFANGLLYDVG